MRGVAPWPAATASPDLCPRHLAIFGASQATVNGYTIRFIYIYIVYIYIYNIYNIYIHTWMCTSVSSWFMSMVTVHLNMREIQSTVQVGCTSKQGIGVWDGEPGTWWRGHHEIMVMMMLMHLDFRPVFYNDSCFQGLEMNVSSPWAANSWIDACIACIYCMHRCIRTHTHTHTHGHIVSVCMYPVAKATSWSMSKSESEYMYI